MKNLIALFFLVPFVISALSAQAFATKFIGSSLGQLIAYANVALLLAGIIFQLGEKRRFPGTIVIWFIFYMLYYAIGLWGNIIQGTDAPLLKTTIPVIYFIAFSLFLSQDANRKLFMKTALIAFLIANILLIYFQKINFSMDHDGIYEYSLDRAGGVYGDANNAAVVCLLGFVFLTFYKNAASRFRNYLKYAGILICIYGLWITYSKTGFLVLIIISAVIFRKLLNPKRILLLLVSVPIATVLFFQLVLSGEVLNATQKSRVMDVINLITLNTSEVSYSGRDVLLQNMLNYINENPFIGNGIYFSTAIRGHNTIFGVWADAGILCFLIFLFLLGYHFRKAWMSEEKVRYFSLSVLIILTIFMITLQTIINQPYLIVLFPLLGYLMQENTDNQNPINFRLETKNHA